MTDAAHIAAYRTALDDIAATIGRHLPVLAPHFDIDDEITPRDEGEPMRDPMLVRFVLITDWQSMTDVDEWERPTAAQGIDHYPVEMRQSDLVGLLVRAADKERTE